MLTGHLGNVYIRKMPCSRCKTPTSLWGPWVGDRGEAWVGQGGSWWECGPWGQFPTFPPLLDAAAGEAACRQASGQRVHLQRLLLPAGLL